MSRRPCSAVRGAPARIAPWQATSRISRSRASGPPPPPITGHDLAHDSGVHLVAEHHRDGPDRVPVLAELVDSEPGSREGCTTLVDHGRLLRRAGDHDRDQELLDLDRSCFRKLVVEHPLVGRVLVDQDEVARGRSAHQVGEIDLTENIDRGGLRRRGHLERRLTELPVGPTAVREAGLGDRERRGAGDGICDGSRRGGTMRGSARPERVERGRDGRRDGGEHLRLPREPHLPLGRVDVDVHEGGVELEREHRDRVAVGRQQRPEPGFDRARQRCALDRAAVDREEDLVRVRPLHRRGRDKARDPAERPRALDRQQGPTRPPGP